ncbi:MAG: sigma-70 family RNA polymerase sigma factor [bacterium]|nr:sigma-70 family RNA polymerase sigma factor [bacterium]
MSLIERLQTHQPQAWRDAVQIYGPVVYHWCQRRGLQGVDAQDVSQEVFRSLSQQIGRFRLDMADSSFRGWLWTITQRRIVDHFRRQGKEPKGQGGTTAQLAFPQLADDQPPGNSPSSPPSESDASDLIDRVSAEFSESHWRAFWRTAVDGVPAVEVAEELNFSTAAVYKAKSRVLARLREMLGDENQVQ